MRMRDAQPALDLLEFVTAYKVCALWADNIDDKALFEIDETTEGKMIDDCKKFMSENAEDLKTMGDMKQAGHDFWLTRNGHGAGFWDRGLGAVGERLTKSAVSFGVVSMYIGDDGKVYQE